MIQASAEFCFGRDAFCQEVVKAVQSSRCVLLFGGRQSGKTTALLKITQQLSCAKASIEDFSYIDVPVYVDLMQLSPDARHGEFYQLLLTLATQACRQQLSGFQAGPTTSSLGTASHEVELFSSELALLAKAAGQVKVQFIFLLDEAKRVLSKERFPRGFQDNLFSLLYGQLRPATYQLGIVFAGAQDLYEFSVDSTSPIGSRAARKFLDGLGIASLIELLTKVHPGSEHDIKSIAAALHTATGGHAGLSTRMAEYLSKQEPRLRLDVALAAPHVMTDSEALMRMWVLALADDARCVLKALLKSHALSLKEISAILANLGKNTLGGSPGQVMEEFVFTGIAKRESSANGPVLRAINQIFWSYVDHFSIEESLVSSNQVWQQIEQVESALREFVLKGYKSRWPQDYERRMRQVLMNSWSGIEQRLRESQERYRLSNNHKRTVMECMYFGHLIDLMLDSSAWPIFGKHFRDQRELRDIKAAIAPVRNDRAHFVPVPPKELSRCSLCCDDLLVLIS